MSLRPLVVACVLAGGALLNAGQTGDPSHVSAQLNAVHSFLYQLQDIDLTAIGQTCYDLVVIDYSADGGEEGEFSPAQIAALGASPGGAKLVLSYMSIGEAEDYRFYWPASWEPGDPSWLDEENPNWSGNYKARYWDAEWQRIILQYTDRLIDAGFHGAYLDLIDTYEYYELQGRSTAAAEMVAFVGAIRAHAVRRNPHFLIVVQNAAELAEAFPGYLELVDGIGQEDMYYGYLADDVPTPPEVTAEMESRLDAFLATGLPVFTIDYAATPHHIDDAYEKSRAKRYVPFVTTRDLDELIVNPGHDPCEEGTTFRTDVAGDVHAEGTFSAASHQAAVVFRRNPLGHVSDVPLTPVRTHGTMYEQCGSTRKSMR
jgi:cysteinyl-tRNA synthetase